MRRTLSLACAVSVLAGAGVSAPASAHALRSGAAADVTRRADVRDLGHAPATALVNIVVGMSYRHEADLQALVQLQATRRSPYFHRYLSAAQFANYFAPSEQTYAATVAALRRAGFRITGMPANRTIVDAVAPVGVAERYFATQIDRVTQTGYGVRYANVRPATMPLELRGSVDAVSGLSDLIVARPAFRFARNAGRHVATPRTVANAPGRGTDRTCFGFLCFGTPTPAPTKAPTPAPTTAPTAAPSKAPTAAPTHVPTAAPTSVPTGLPTAAPSSAPGGGAPIGGALKGPDGGFGPVAVANGYDLPVQHGYDGAGRATGVTISGDFSEADLASYLAYFGITRTGPATTRVEVDGGATYDSSFSTSNASVEAALDVETIVGNAPGTHLVMYLIPDLTSAHIEDGYNQAVTDGIVDVDNSSFGGCETGDTSLDTISNNVATQGAAKGITFGASSGDSGSAECGTSLFGLGGSTGVSSPASGPEFTAVGGTSLTVNNDGSYASEAAWSGSGGGVSTEWTLPSYQSGVSGASTSGRNVPDVAFAADPNTGTSLYFGGAWNGPIGGTSWACPIFSALQTEIDQRDGSKAGFVDGRIYAAFKTYGYGEFHDVTSGSNGSFSAKTGFDEVTGIGSVKGFGLSAVE